MAYLRPSPNGRPPTDEPVTALPIILTIMLSADMLFPFSQDGTAIPFVSLYITQNVLRLSNFLVAFRYVFRSDLTNF